MTRIALYEDLEKVNELRCMVYKIHAKERPDIFIGNMTKEIIEFIYKLYENERYNIIVETKDDVVCGFAIIEYVDRPQSFYSKAKHYINIMEFGVDEKYRREKIATSMMNFIKKHAMERGFERLELDVWEFNKDASAFYEKNNFRTYRKYMECEIDNN